MSRTGEVGRWLVRKGMEGERQRGKGQRWTDSQMALAERWHIELRTRNSMGEEAEKGEIVERSGTGVQRNGEIVQGTVVKIDRIMVVPRALFFFFFYAVRRKKEM